MACGGLCFRASIVVPILCAPASAQITQRVSYGANGMEGHGYSILNAISADGRAYFVAHAYSSVSALYVGRSDDGGVTVANWVEAVPPLSSVVVVFPKK